MTIAADEPGAELPVDSIEWAALMDRLYRGTDAANTGRWKQDEHLTVIGPTGGGKTTMVLQLMALRSSAVIFATKPKDPTLAGLKRQGWEVARSWDRRPPGRRIILWPQFRSLRDTSHQRVVFHDALESIFGHGGAWAVCLDDLPYLCDELGLRSSLATLYNQARALDMPLVGCAQRPRHVPLAALNQATHLLVQRTADDEDVKRLASLGVFSRDLLRSTIPHLPKYHALYLNLRTGDVLHVQPPALSPTKGARQ